MPSHEDGLSGLRPNLVNVAAALIIFVIIVVAFKELATLLQPLFVAIFLYYVGTPIVRVLTRHKWPPMLAHFLVVVSLAGIVIAFAWAMGVYLDDFAQQLPQFQKRLQDVVTSTTDGMREDMPYFAKRARGMLRRLDFSQPVDLGLKSLVGNVVGFVSAGLLVIFYLIFIIHEKHTLPGRLKAIYGKDRSEKIREIWQRVNDSITGYLYVKFLASLMTAALALVVMLIYGLDLAFLWSAILFFANFIPYIGSIVAFLFPVAVAILEFDSAWKVLSMTGIFVAIDMFVGNYWEPRTAGDRLNVSPLIVMLSLAFWGWLWGFVGVILSVPITVSLKYILENIPYTRNVGLLISHEEPG
jgi:AI-2 transport protein TqsA